MTMHGNRDFILEAVKQNGTVLCYASDELQRDYEREMAAQGIGFYPYPVVVGYVLIPVQHNTDY